MKMTARVLLIMALAMALALATSLATPIAPSEVEEHLTNEEVSPSLRGVSRLLAQSNPKASMTCDKYPRICYARGSPGRECCKKKCVNVMNDNQNCGWCGRRCGYGQTCCSGQCVNVLYDLRNCGACKNKCKHGGFCNYGMCNYA